MTILPCTDGRTASRPVSCTTTRRAFSTAVRATAVVAALLAATPARADCTQRPAQAAETAFHARALAALVAVLPPAPAGVTAVDGRPYDFKNPPAFMEVLCEGSKEGPFSITVRRQYVRKHSEAERRYWSAQYDKLQSEMVVLKQLPPDKLAEQQALRQQSNAAWQVMRDAEKAGDKAAAQVSDARYRSLRNQADAVDTQHLDGVRAALQDLDRRRVAIDLERQRVDIVIAMNLPRLPTAEEGMLVGRHGLPSPGRSAGLKVHNVAWTASGSDGPLRQALTAALEKAPLAAWVGQTLPTAAASEAAAEAARAAPSQVADLPAAATTGPGVGAVAAPASATAVAATAVPPAPAKATDPLKQAGEAVNRLRGLLGR